MKKQIIERVLHSLITMEAKEEEAILQKHVFKRQVGHTNKTHESTAMLQSSTSQYNNKIII